MTHAAWMQVTYRDVELKKSTIFFFSSRRRHTRSKRDWSSDVCSSDLRRASSTIFHRASVHGWKIVDDARLQLGAEIGGGRELALGKPIHAVVFNNVNYRQIAPHEMHELSHADGGCVAVTTDAEGHQTAIGQHCSGGHGGHAAMDGVEAVRTAHEISRALRGAPDPTELGDTLGLHAHLIHRIDDALGNGIVAAAGA